MVNLWMPGAMKYSIGNAGAMEGGPARAVWHITSNSKDWTFRNELGWFTGGGQGVAPHLLWDPFTGQIAQFFPADSRALALENAGSVRTNRTGKYCIQIEIVFTANETVNGKRYATVRDTPCKGLDQIMDWLRSLGISDRWPGGAPFAFTRDTVSLAMWENEGGHYGHHQAPGNSHVDPGPMPNIFDYGTGGSGGDGGSDSSSAGVARYQVTINGLKYGYGAHGDHVTKVGKALVSKGFGKHYQEGPGPDWSDADTLNYSDYQKSLGYSGTAPHQDADGVPGEGTLKQLLGTLPSPPVPSVPTVSVSKLRAAANTDPGAAQGHQTYAAGVKIVESALVKAGLLDKVYAGDGSFGTMTIAAYSRWQLKLYPGASTKPGGDADGKPGRDSLVKLGHKYGFNVVD